MENVAPPTEPLWILYKFKELKAIHNVSAIQDAHRYLWILYKFKELKAIHNMLII